MRKIILKPLSLIALTTMALYGCASSNNGEDTTAMGATTMSETQTMAGSTSETDGVDALVVEETVVVPVATLAVTTLVMENPVEVDEMFEEIGDTEKYNVMELARTSPNLSTFVKLIEQAGLVDAMQRADKLTLFAPTNEAFAKLPKEKLENLLLSDNIALLSTMLQAHVLASDVSSIQLQNNTRIQMSENSYIPIETRIGAMTSVGGAQIVKDDIEASNGRIHVIDTVILPSEDAREGNLR